jgi:hypothetical protein
MASWSGYLAACWWTRSSHHGYYLYDKPWTNCVNWVVAQLVTAPLRGCPAMLVRTRWVSWNAWRILVAVGHKDYHIFIRCSYPATRIATWIEDIIPKSEYNCTLGFTGVHWGLPLRTSMCGNLPWNESLRDSYIIFLAAILTACRNSCESLC